MNNDDNDDKGGIELGIRWERQKAGRPSLYTKRWEQNCIRKLYLSNPTSPVQIREDNLIRLIGDGFELEPRAAPALDTRISIAPSSS